MRKLKLSVVQMPCSDKLEENIERADDHVRAAVEHGANVVLLQELFEGLYFCQEQSPTHFDRAASVDEHAVVKHFKALAKELEVVLRSAFSSRPARHTTIPWL